MSRVLIKFDMFPYILTSSSMMTAPARFKIFFLSYEDLQLSTGEETTFTVSIVTDNESVGRTNKVPPESSFIV